MKIFLSLKTNYIEKLNIETKKTLWKRFDTVVAYEIVSGMVRRSYDIAAQSRTVTMLFLVLIIPVSLPKL